MRRVLDGLYSAALALAALALVAIGVLVFVQVAGRVLDRTAIAFGAAPFGIAVPSLAEIGGFLFVAAVCLGLGPTLRAAGHVRVTMLLRAGGAGLERVTTLLVLALALGLAVIAAWNAGVQALDSYAFGSLSIGMVKVPLWAPQGAMTLGLAVLCIALADELVASLRGQTPAFRAAERARELGGGVGDGH